MRSTRNIIAALGIVTVLTASAAFAGVFGGSGGGLSVGLANTLYCQLAGGANCNMQGSITLTNGTAGVLMSTLGGGSGAFATSSSPGGILRVGTNGVIGAQTDLGATAIAGQVADSVTTATAGTSQFAVYGEGKVAVARQQSVSCAAGVLALDPTSSVVYVNANSAACVITLGEANAITGSDVEIILTANVSGAVTFPNVANVHAGPAACTTTGLSTIGSSYRIHYAATLNEYVGVACNSN